MSVRSRLGQPKKGLAVWIDGLCSSTRRRKNTASHTREGKVPKGAKRGFNEKKR